VLVLLLICSSAYSQKAFEPGCIIVSGTLGFASLGGDLYKDADNKRMTSISLEPDAMFFILPNIFLGVTMDFERSSQGDWNKTQIGIGPSVGLGLQPPGSQTWPFLAAGFQFNSSKEKPGAGVGEEKSTGSDIALGGGVIYSVRKHLGIELDLAYVIHKEKPEGADKSVSGNVIAVGIGLAGILF
jgi:hypothetical protein